MSSGECSAAIGLGTAGFLAECKSTAKIIESRNDVVYTVEPVDRLLNPPHISTMSFHDVSSMNRYAKYIHATALPVSN